MYKVTLWQRGADHMYHIVYMHDARTTLEALCLAAKLLEPFTFSTPRLDLPRRLGASPYVEIETAPDVIEILHPRYTFVEGP